MNKKKLMRNWVRVQIRLHLSSHAGGQSLLHKLLFHSLNNNMKIVENYSLFNLNRKIHCMMSNH